MATASNSITPMAQETFGERLIRVAKERGGPIEQVPLSKWFWDEHGIKISGPMINRYKNEDALPRLDQCRQFAIALGVTVEWLYTGRGLKYPGPALTRDEQEIIRRLRSIESPEERRNWLGHMMVSLPPAPGANGHRAA